MSLVRLNSSPPTPGAATEIAAEWRGGWRTVATAMLGTSVAGIHLYTFGALIAPIEGELGWSRTEISSGLLAYSIVTVCLLPFVGLLLDRWGPRRIALTGVAFYCSAIAALGLAGSSHTLWLAIWCLVGAGGCFIKPVLWVSVVSRLFDLRRGAAIAIVLCGGGLAGLVMPTAADALASRFDWRVAYVGLAFVAATVMIPLVLLNIRGATASASTAKAGADAPSTLSGVAPRKAYFSVRYLKLAIAALMFSVTMLGLMINYVPITTGKGLDRAAALTFVGLIGISSVVGRLVAGFLYDRIHGPVVASASFLIPVAAVLYLLEYSGGAAGGVFVAIVIGFSLGAEHDSMSYLTTRYFGLKHFGVIFAPIVSILVAGEGVGPVLASYIHDRFGSYDPFLWICAALLLISSVLMATMGKYEQFEPAPSKAG